MTWRADLFQPAAQLRFASSSNLAISFDDHRHFLALASGVDQDPISSESVPVR